MQSTRDAILNYKTPMERIQGLLGPYINPLLGLLEKQ